MRLKDGKRWSWFYRVLGWIRYVAASSVIITGAFLKADATKFSEFAEWAGNSVSWIQTQAWQLIILGMIIGGLAQLLRSHVGSPRLWGVLKTELDDMRETISSPIFVVIRFTTIVLLFSSGFNGAFIGGHSYGHGRAGWSLSCVRDGPHKDRVRSSRLQISRIMSTVELADGLGPVRCQSSMTFRMWGLMQTPRAMIFGNMEKQRV